MVLERKNYLGNHFTLGPTAHYLKLILDFQLPKFEILRKLARFSTLGSSKLGS
jgi:hypothetical protein